jgi:hypothetical protein
MSGVPIHNDSIHDAIHIIRGQKVILDRDLASLYEIETRALNQAVKRNPERFPGDFMFELTREEITRISQFVTSSSRIKFSKRVLAFTEQGVAMLSGVLNSPRAVQVNIAIMRAFVQLRRILAAHADLAKKLEELEVKYDGQFRVVFEAIRELMKPPEPKPKRFGFHVREKRAEYRTR